MANVTLDNMEYSSNALAQAAYVTNGFTSTITQSQTSATGNNGFDWGGIVRNGQGFKVATTETITKFTFKLKQLAGGEHGTLTGYIYDDSAGSPNSIVATFSNMAVSSMSTTYTDYEFTGTFVPTVGAQYYAVVTWTDGQAAEELRAAGVTPSAYADGSRVYYIGSWTVESVWDLYFLIYQNVVNLQSYSEASIKTQGSYALKAVAAITASLNKTLTKTFASPLDLTGINTLKVDMRASRTGANVKLGLHDTGGTTTELTPTINSADTYETKTWDISAVSDANKNAIDTLILTQVNADSATTWYVDNFYGFAYTFEQALSETITTSDNARKLDAFRKLLDSITISESINNSWLYFMVLSETINISDTYSRTWDMVHILIDTVTISDSYTRLWNIIHVLSETININDVVNKATSGRTLFETITISDIVSNVQHRNFILICTESISTIDNLQEWLNKIDKSITWSSVSIGNNLWVIVPTATNIWM